MAAGAGRGVYRSLVHYRRAIDPWDLIGRAAERTQAVLEESGEDPAPPNGP